MDSSLRGLSDLGRADLAREATEGQPWPAVVKRASTSTVFTFDIPSGKLT